MLEHPDDYKKLIYTNFRKVIFKEFAKIKKKTNSPAKDAELKKFLETAY